MFKALLKTLPSLSGNMKLGCFIDDYKKNNKKFSCNVKNAKLLPISHTLYDKNIYVNLKNNAFEYDVKNFYKNYYDIFYSSNYNYSKINIPIIDFTNTISDGNEDFMYGCKRISFKKYLNQFAFFAPIYIENIKDIKGKYFKITCTFTKYNSIKRELIIDISNNINDNEIWYHNHNGENYLANYLTKYAEKIDNKVIYMSSTYKNMYYGIDLLHGGFVHIEDNISKNLYSKYYTINDFDAIINFGYKRNNLMMKQIIPLSFYFNPQNLLTNYENEIYADAKISISGEWYTEGNNEPEPFYDFADNYNFYNESNYQLLPTNKFLIVNSNMNIMDMPYPAFKEASSENYKYINTIIKNYNRWKLKYSDDDYPYIINNNFAFSNNQNSLYSYKEFPLIYKSKNAICKMKNEQYNMLFDMVDIYNDYGNLLNIKSEYYDMFNKNYITNFYNLLVKREDETYENIFTNDKYWTNISDDNKLYYKGILYDFNIIYSQYKNMPKIDKFSIFVNPEMMDCISNTEYNNTYNSVKYTIKPNKELDQIIDNNQSYILETLSSYIYKYDFINQNLSYITNNEAVYNDCRCAIENKNGDYVDLNAYFLNNTNKDCCYLHYSDNNLYVDVNEIFMYVNIDSDLSTNNSTLYNKVYNNGLEIISGYKTLDVNYKNNIISKLYSELLTIYPSKKYDSNINNLIYSEHKFLQNDDIYWAYDNLYFSIYPNKIKYNLLENSSLLYDLPYDTKITLYYKTDFINYNDLINILIIDDNNRYKNKINKYYISNTLFDKIKNQSYSDLVFVKLKNTNNQYGKYISYNFPGYSSYTGTLINDFHEDVLFIDPYNLTKFYNSLFKDQPLKFYKVENCFCNFLNIDHVYKYYEKLYNDEDLNIKEKNINNYLKNTLYVKIHLLNNVVIDINSPNLNFINTTVKYIKLEEFFIKDEKEEFNINLYNLLDYINYNEDGYFFFTNNYYKDFVNIIDGKLKFKIKNFELCFKKTMGIVNSQLYNLIMQSNKRNIFKDLYLYRLCRNSDYKFEYIMNNITNVEDINDVYFTDDSVNSNTLSDQNFNNISYIFEENQINLYPYFNSIYNEEKINTKIYNDSFINNIIKCDNAYVYKHGVYNVDTLVYLPKDKLDSNNCLCSYRYSLYSKYNNDMIDSYTFVKNYIGNNDELSYFQDYGKMITYTQTIGENTTTYGFYIIHECFDNTKNTLNLITENYDNINVVAYINNISSYEIFNNQYKYLTEYYHNLIPYINNSNIVKDLLNNVNIIIKPNKYTLTNIYQQLPNTNINNEVYSYNIIIKGKSGLQLLRYFDNIIPYIYQTNSVSSYYLYYKNTDKFIENDLYNKNLSYIMYNKSNSIYDNKFISYFDNTKNLNPKLSYLSLEISKFEPVEYKNYNNNKYYNLETSFDISLESGNIENKNLFTKSELENIENDKNKIFELFNQYLLNKNNKLTKNDILFLYKKYEVKFSHNIKSFHKNKNGERDYDLYTLTIKYNLY